MNVFNFKLKQTQKTVAINADYIASIEFENEKTTVIGMTNGTEYYVDAKFYDVLRRVENNE